MQRQPDLARAGREIGARRLAACRAGGDRSRPLVPIADRAVGVGAAARPIAHQHQRLGEKRQLPPCARRARRRSPGSRRAVAIGWTDVFSIMTPGRRAPSTGRRTPSPRSPSSARSSRAPARGSAPSRASSCGRRCPRRVTPGTPLRSSSAGVSSTPAATHTTGASIVTRSPAARVFGSSCTASTPRTAPASKRMRSARVSGQDARAGALGARHVGEQRRLLRAARAAEVAETEVGAAAHAARRRRAPPSRGAPRRARARAALRFVCSGPVGSAWMSLHTRSTNGAMRRVGEAAEPVVVAPAREQLGRRAEAEGVVDDRRAADAGAGIERHAGRRVAASFQSRAVISASSPVKSAGLEPRPGLEDDDAPRRLSASAPRPARRRRRCRSRPRPQRGSRSPPGSPVAETGRGLAGEPPPLALTASRHLADASSSSITALNCSKGCAPTSSRPLITNDGVPVTPTDCPSADLGLHLRLRLLAVEAVVELRLVELLGLDEAPGLLLHVARVHVLLVLEEAVVHLPVRVGLLLA